MSYRLQPSTLETRGTHMRILIAGPWSATPANLQDTQILRSWLVYDSEREDESQGQPGWNVVLGLAVALGISAGFWAGVGLLIAYLAN